MHRSFLTVSSLALGISLLLVGFSPSALAQKNTIASLQPTSGWKVTRIDGNENTDDSYCALARQYDQGLVLTLGRNMAEEYSLAIDFQEAKLNTEKAYSLTLQPGPGQIRAYEMMPASQRAMVVRLGYDESFFKALEESNALKAEIDGENYQFNLPDMKAGQDDLTKCMAGLKGKASPTKVASGFSAEKVDNAKPLPKQAEPIKAEEPVKSKPVPEPVTEISMEPPKAEEPKPLEAKPPKTIEISKVESKKIFSKAVKEEEPKLAQIIEAPKAIEAPPPILVRPDEQSESKPVKMTKIEAKKAEEPKIISKAVSAAPSNTKSAFDNRSSIKEKISKRPPVSVQTASKVPDNKAVTVQASKMLSPEPDQRVEIEAPKVQKKKAEPPIQAKEPDPALVNQLDDLKAENQRLAAALQGQEQKMASFDAKVPEAEKELEEMRARMRKLEEENKKYYEDAKQARGQIDTAVVDAGNQALKKIREYERKLEAAQSDNLVLSKEIEEIRRIKEDSRLDVVAGDWDLEKATKRYNEAEREIKRLGMLLEQQRSAHRQEKIELEEMLFDPAVTDQEQRRRLTELELQLAEAEKQLRARGISPSAGRYAHSPMSERVDVGARPQLAPMPQGGRMAAVPQPQVVSQPLVQSQKPQIQPAPRAPVPEKVERVSMTPPKPKTPSRPLSQPASVTAPAKTSFGQSKLQQLLSGSGVVLRNGVAKLSGGQYRWSADNLTGHAQVVPKQQAGSMDQFAQNYIAKIKQNCGGDFASVPTTSTGTMQTYEVACISVSRSTSSSIVFTQQENDLVAISHESSADDMDAAMDARDRIAASL